jgi:hypothetical protein
MNEHELKAELDSLHAETLALQMILITLLNRMLTAPHVGQMVIPSLNEAADRVEDFAIMMGDRASPRHVVKALEIVEQLRTVIVGNDEKPRHGV